MIVTSQILDAIQSRFTGDAGITAIVPDTRIGTFLEQDVAYPHIKYELQFEPGNVKEGLDYSVDLVINVWSDYKGLKQLLQIHDTISAAFEGIPVTIASGDGFACFETGFSNSVASDGLIRQATITFKLLYGDE